MREIRRDVCEVELRGRAALVRISGPLDAGCAGSVERTLRRLGTAGLERIVLDLRELGSLDEEGVSVLVAALARAERDGVEVALVRPDGAVQRAGAVRDTPPMAAIA